MRDEDDASPSRQGSDNALGVTVESVTKVLGALTGAAAIAYALGALVLGRRLQAADLPWREGVAALPNDQVLAAGTVEAGYSLLGALLILVTALVLVWLSSKRQLRWLGSIGTLEFLLCLLGFVSVLLVPFNLFAMLCLAVVLTLTYWLYQLHKPWRGPDEVSRFWGFLVRGSEFPRSYPFGRVALLIVVISVVLAAGRIYSFAESFNPATATFTDPSRVTIEGALYIGSGGDTVVLGRDGSSASLLLLPATSVEAIEIREGDSGTRVSPSLISRWGVLPITCFYPICREG